MTLKSVFKDLFGSKRRVWRVPRMLLIAAIIGLLGIMIFENKLIFFPSRFSPGDKPYSWRLSGQRTVDPEEVMFKSDDQTDLCGWYYSLSRDGKKLSNDYVILLCHGNAGHLAGRHQKSSSLCGLGVDLFIFDYRGYGKSSGSPNERGVCEDAQAAWDLLLKRGWKPEQIILYGKSLGGAVAIDLASKVKCAALITESTFTSIPDMASKAYPFIPRFIVRTQLDSAKKINRITCPKLFMHGERDSIIPVDMAKELYEKAVEPKKLVLFPVGDHNDVFHQDGYLDTWREFLETAVSLKLTLPTKESNGENSEMR